MKLDRSLSGSNWRNALQLILKKTKRSLDPVIIVREDAPEQVFKLKLFLINSEAAFTRLGVTCSVTNALTELLHLLDGSVQKEGSLKIESVIPLILNCKIAREHRFRFVIDNCHYLTPDHLFYFLGLIMNLEMRVQFWFFFTEDNLKRWRTKHSKEVFKQNDMDATSLIKKLEPNVAAEKMKS